MAMFILKKSHNSLDIDATLLSDDKYYFVDNLILTSHVEEDETEITANVLSNLKINDEEGE